MPLLNSFGYFVVDIEFNSLFKKFLCRKLDTSTFLTTQPRPQLHYPTETPLTNYSVFQYSWNTYSISPSTSFYITLQASGMSQNSQSTGAIHPLPSTPGIPRASEATAQVSQDSLNTGDLQAQLDQARIRIAELENQSKYTYSLLEAERTEKNALKHEFDQVKAVKDRFASQWPISGGVIY